MATGRVWIASGAILGLCMAAMGQTTRPATTQTQEWVLDRPGQSSYTLADLRSQHERMGNTVVLVSFLSNGDMRTAQHCYLLTDGRNGMIRYVRYDAVAGAIQGGGPSPATAPIGEMPEARQSALRAVLSKLPQGQSVARDADVFLMSWNANGTRITRTYDRTRLPPVVLALCEFLNIPATWL